MMRVILSSNPYRDKGMKAAQRAARILGEAGVDTCLCLPFELSHGSVPELPRELKSSKAGSLLNKVVAAGSAILQGTALLTLSQETREMDGGLILREGNVEINCAFETQLRLLRGSMAAEVAGILFPQ